MRPSPAIRFATAALLLLGSACGGSSIADGCPEGSPCFDGGPHDADATTDADAASVDGGSDASTMDGSRPDSTVDASGDAGTDGAMDSGPDGTTDTGPDCVTTTYYADVDADGWGDDAATMNACELPVGYVARAGDCDDGHAAAYPGGTEVCDGLDNDCDGTVDEALTQGCGSSVGACSPGTQTCADGSWGACVGEVGPSTEVCEGSIDENCDGTVDEGCACAEGSSRPCGSDVGACTVGSQGCAAGSWGRCAGDHGPTSEVCDGVDNDCDGMVDEGDPGGGAGCGSDVGACTPGVLHCTAGALSCEGGTRAGAEVCDGLDNDCDGTVDEGLTTTYYPDTDHDGHGDAASAGVAACAAPTDYVASNDDCDDANSGAYPGASETCDGVDNDCDGTVDEGCSCTDGASRSCGSDVGACVAGSQTCAAGTWSACTGSMDPSAEVCDGLDNDCNGSVDDGVTAPPCSVQLGVCAGSTQPCGGATGFVACAAADYGPDYEAVETRCDGLDNDCDGSVDEGLTTGYWPDGDHDGYGFSTPLGTPLQACSAPSGYAATGGDCDDGQAAIHPGATEVCDGVDNNCDFTIDEGVTTLYFIDFDNDGYGAAGTAGRAMCAPDATFKVANDADCDDAAASTNPGAAEVCDGHDNDCDGSVDEGVTTRYYPDVDRDGHGDASDPGTLRCSAMAGWVTSHDDCNDGAFLAHPGGTETCDGLDNDCNGSVDDGLTPPRCMRQSGVCTGSTERCGGTSGWLACDATDYGPDYEPTEASCDGLDNDCDNAIDEGVKTLFYPDMDMDGYGRDISVMAACTAPAGRVANNTDCNDGDNSIHPGAAEVCDVIDHDCDGVRGGAAATAWCNDPAQALPNVSTQVCASNACAISACAAGYDDCDGTATNGCESDLSADGLNCGGCGSTCPLGVGTCSASTCDPAVKLTSSGYFPFRCALRASGGVSCWGDNRFGQLGDGTTTSHPPAPVTGISTAVDIDAGGASACAVLADGRVMCWGLNGTGKLGNGTTTDSSTPVAVVGITTATQVSVGGGHACALLGDGSVECWGDNSSGQLGHGGTISRSRPVLVDASTMGTVTGLSAGGSHTCAVNSSGVVYCWGDNRSGQLGNGSHANSSRPVRATSMAATYVQVVTGSNFSCARRGGGATKCWGSNWNGQLGDGTTSSSSTPVAVSGANAALLVAGMSHACAVRSAGSMVCWGLNGNRQLGDGTTTDQSSPTPVSGLPGSVSTAAAGDRSTCAIVAGDIYCWGQFWLWPGQTVAGIPSPIHLTP